jgi:hypothetical protein
MGSAISRLKADIFTFSILLIYCLKLVSSSEIHTAVSNEWIVDGYTVLDLTHNYVWNDGNLKI